MTTHQLINRIEYLFNEVLDKKTNWGRNELLIKFNACVRIAMGEYIDQAEGNAPRDVSRDETYGDFKPKGYGGVVLHGVQDSPLDVDGSEENKITRREFDDDEDPIPF